MGSSCRGVGRGGDPRGRAGEFVDDRLAVDVPCPKLAFFSQFLPGSLRGEDEYVVLGGLYRVRRARFEFTRALENARGMGMVIHILEAHERLCAVTDGAEQGEHARKAASLRKQMLAGRG